MEIRTGLDLKKAILELEDKKARQEKQLVQNFHSFKESLTPGNLLRTSFNKLKETPGITGTILKASLGLGVGLLSKRILVGKAPGFIRKMIGSAVQMGLTGLVAKKTEEINPGDWQFLKNIFRSRKKKPSR